MKLIDPPLGFADAEVPVKLKQGFPSSYFAVKYPAAGLRCDVLYKSRIPSYVYEDAKRFDDYLEYAFTKTNKRLKANYGLMINDQFPKIVEAYRAYRAVVYFQDYSFLYEESTSTYIPTVRNFSNDVNGRNNIFTFYPAQYWDAELCQRALGFGPDEVIARLQGQVPKAERVLDGVYIVINHDIDMTYETYAELNDRLRPLLGLR